MIEIRGWFCSRFHIIQFTIIFFTDAASTRFDCESVMYVDRPSIKYLPFHLSYENFSIESVITTLHVKTCVSVKMPIKSWAYFSLTVSFYLLIIISSGIIIFISFRLWAPARLFANFSMVDSSTRFSSSKISNISSTPFLIMIHSDRMPSQNKQLIPDGATIIFIPFTCPFFPCTMHVLIFGFCFSDLVTRRKKMIQWQVSWCQFALIFDSKKALATIWTPNIIVNQIRSSMIFRLKNRINNSRIMYASTFADFPSMDFSVFRWINDIAFTKFTRKPQGSRTYFL